MPWGAEMPRVGFFCLVFSCFVPLESGIWPIREDLANQDVSGIIAAVLEAPAAKGSRLVFPLVFILERTNSSVEPGCPWGGEDVDLAAGPWWLVVQAPSGHFRTLTAMRVHILLV